MLLGFHGVSTEIKQQSLSLFKDSVREVTIQLLWHKKDSMGLTTLMGDVSQGIDFLGASNARTTRVGSSLTFTKFLIKAMRVHYLASQWNLILHSSAQFSLKPLASTFEFGLGGDEYLRAYDTSFMSAQNGASWKVSLAYNFDVINFPILNGLIISAFYDGGLVWGKARDLSSLQSVGLDANVQFKKYLYSGLSVAYPLGNVKNDGDRRSLRFFYQISLRV